MTVGGEELHLLFAEGLVRAIRRSKEPSPSVSAKRMMRPEPKRDLSRA